MGKVYGLPLELTNWAIYLNKKIFRDAGLDANKDYQKPEEVMTVSEKNCQTRRKYNYSPWFDFRYSDYLISLASMVEQLGGKLISDDGKLQS